MVRIQFPTHWLLWFGPVAKDESRNDRNVRVHLYFGNLSLEGASVPQVHAPYNVVVNGFES